MREPHATYSGETRFPLIAQNLHRYFFYAALFVGILLSYDVAQAFRGPDGNFGFGIGSLILLANVIFIWGYTLGCHSCRHITAGRLKNFSKHPVRYWAWTKVLLAERAALAVRLDLAGHADAERPLHSPPGQRGLLRSANLQLTERASGMTSEIDRLSYDVVVIGAGGSGLRAAIEARLNGKKTAIISKSLFGKAHTVMAEGGCAAAMGNVNPNDNWQVHFRDTMRGGKFLNNWRMAELHAKEAPDRVLGARGLGRGLRPDQGRQDQPAELRRARATRGWRTSATGPAWR